MTNMILQSLEESDVPEEASLDGEIQIPDDRSACSTDSTHDGSTAASHENVSPNRIFQQASINIISTHVDEIISTSTPAEDDIITESPEEKWRRRKIVALYLITITILFADMNLLAPNLSTIAEEFDMDDDERDVKLGGMIALGFFFVGAPVSFAIGWLADSIDRSPLFAATVFVGELGCFFTAFVRAYWQLYVCRLVA